VDLQDGLADSGTFAGAAAARWDAMTGDPRKSRGWPFEAVDVVSVLPHLLEIDPDARAPHGQDEAVNLLQVRNGESFGTIFASTPST